MRTLILGAGASVDYNYPTGVKMLEEIKHILLGRKMTISGKHPLSTRSAAGMIKVLDFLRPVFENLNISADEISHFNTLVQPAFVTSIDVFLAKEKNGKFSMIGKILICFILMERESQKHDGWYKLIIEHFHDHNPGFDFKDFKIITFNYDRSFESILFEYVFNYYRLRYPDNLEIAFNAARQDFKTLELVHIYGSITLPIIEQFPTHQDYSQNYIPYGLMPGTLQNGDQRTITILIESIKNIDTIYDKTLSRERELKIHNILDTSKDVFTIGLNFHKMNLDILCKFTNVKNLWQHKARIGNFTKMLVCCHGLSENRQVEIKSCIPQVKFSREKMEAKEFCQEYVF